MTSILRTLWLHWRHPETGEMISQVVAPGVETSAPEGLAPGVSVTVEHVLSVDPEPTPASEAPDMADVAPEALQALGGTEVSPES